MRSVAYVLIFSLIAILSYFGYRKHLANLDQSAISKPMSIPPQPISPPSQEVPREKLIDAFRAQSLKEIPLPPGPTPSPEVQKQIELIRAKIKSGDYKDIPDPGGQIRGGQKIFEAATVNQATAKEFLTRMKNCVTHLNNQLGMPEAMRLQMQSFCVQNAEMIVKKYPALRVEFDRGIMKSASPSAIDFKKKMANGG